jgi:hypothetical protein
MKQRTPIRNNASPAPAAVHDFASVKATLRSLQDHRAVVCAEVIRRERAGEHTDSAKALEPKKRLRAEALGLLNGAAVEHLPIGKTGRTWADARHELDVIDLAISEAIKLANTLHLQEANARLEARLSDLRAAMRQIALCEIGLERARQARDQNVAEVGSRELTRQFDDLVPGDRLANTASPTYRRLEGAMRRGWIGEKEFLSEFERARKARR